VKEPKKEMSEEELREFWKNYQPPADELTDEFAKALLTNLKAGIAKQQREAEEQKKIPKEGNRAGPGPD
jgi:hypothetical protein